MTDVDGKGLDQQTNGFWTESVIDPEEDIAGAPRLPVLVLLGGDDGTPPAIVPIDRKLTIGRQSDGDGQRLVLSHRRVSRNHACIIAADTWFEVHDLNSANGTYLNGTRISRARIAESGAILFLGGYAMVLRFMSQFALHAIEEERRNPLMGPPTLSGRVALLHQRIRESVGRTDRLLISGAPGTGRASYARAIHRALGRRGRFVLIDGPALADVTRPEELCSTLPLFGGTGAFEGGAITEGTLYVHRFDESSAFAQRELARLVSADRISRDVFVIASTRGLRSKDGRPLEFLLHSFGANLVRIPSLARRKEDILGLIGSILTPRPGWRLSDRALLAVMLYDWPGNLTELSRVFQSLLLAHAASVNLVVRAQHFPAAIWQQLPAWSSTEEEEGDHAHLVGSDPTQTLPPFDSEQGETPITHESIVLEFSRRNRLSERQAQIVSGAIRGLSSKEIAAELGIDYRTVAEHLGRICEKTGLSDRHQLVASVINLLVAILNQRVDRAEGNAEIQHP